LGGPRAKRKKETCEGGEKEEKRTAKLVPSTEANVLQSARRAKEKKIKDVKGPRKKKRKLGGKVKKQKSRPQ